MHLGISFFPHRCSPTLTDGHLIVILSSPRSGSTWLAKFFDCHPDVMYLHEPDIADRGLDLVPYWFDGNPDAGAIEKVRLYFARLLAARTPRAVGKLPFFPKSYRSPRSERLRRALIYMTKGAERCGLPVSPVYIPDFADRGAPSAFVIKSVSALGRAGLLLKANPQIHAVLLLRHPCAYISSLLRGEAKGVINLPPSLGTLLETSAAHEFKARELAVHLEDKVERLAWDWLLSNAEAYRAITASGGIILSYETFVASPVTMGKWLCESLGLGWRPEMEAYLRPGAATTGYYSVGAGTARAADHWRNELSEDAIRRIRVITTRGAVGRIFFQETEASRAAA